MAAVVAGLWFALAGTALAGELEWVVVAEDQRGFAYEASKRPFVPWGFNYDHDEQGRLLEDYWHDEWPKVVEDFREMKALGANVVRIHLQLGKFMDTAETPNESALEQLERLVRLAEEVGLYLNLTGLGCYHKADVPAWYDRLEEVHRWEVQTRFWRAVAKRCAASPAIFCYDLMNEPVVAAAQREPEDWLGRGFAGKHFVQFITLDAPQRPRHEIAREWIARLRRAIREHDQRHSITVGLVPWSLDRPGLKSGFVPEKIAGELDFICVHIYPERGKLDEALETLRGFSAGKPVVIEETFPLKCTPAELEQFIEQSREVAAGWIGFYWGKTAEECRESNELADKLMLAWLELFQKLVPVQDDS